MIEGQADSVSSTGVLSEDLGMPPKPNILVGQDGNISNMPPTQIQERIEVETDAIPSPARSRETVKAEESEPKQQTDQIPHFPSTSLPKSEIPRNKTDPNETKSRQNPSFTTRQRRDKPKSQTVINISNASGFVVGTVITLNPVHTQGTQFKEDIDHRKKEKRQKYFNQLLLCPHELREDDIIIVSENLEGRGLRSLLQHLTMDEEEVDRIKSEFGFKGHSEMTFQLLTRWKCLMSEEDKTPRLNLLCDKLLNEEVYNYGGRKALKGLLDFHFP